MTKKLHIQIDTQSGLPVYRQVMDQIKYYIAGGALAPQSQLPSIRDLAQYLSVNPTTIVKAYNELAHEMVIEMHHGKGAFVCKGAVAFNNSQKKVALRRIAKQIAVEATQLGMPIKQVIQIVEEEVNTLQRENLEPQMPVKIKVVQ